MTDRLAGALITPAAEELRDLVLQRLLKDQPCSQPPDRLDRILLPVDTGQHLIQLAAKSLARGYLLHAGVPPSLGLIRTKRRLRPQHQIPRLMRRDPIRLAKPQSYWAQHWYGEEKMTRTIERFGDEEARFLGAAPDLTQNPQDSEPRPDQVFDEEDKLTRRGIRR
ncbi:MAG: hypothetical protein ACRDJX_09480 [Solirubrobacteraceae bacterium]